MKRWRIKVAVYDDQTGRAVAETLSTKTADIAMILGGRLVERLVGVLLSVADTAENDKTRP
jgi:hypothetical protein